jgi:putative FmdB family regulatory protein
MPTYDYACRACGHEFEEFQSITAPVKRKCPKCGKPKLERLIGTGAGIIFKGGGFYETDYRSEGYKKAAEAERKSAEPPVETKSDSKEKSSTPADKKSDKAESASSQSPTSDRSSARKSGARIESKPTRASKPKRKK